MPRSERRRAPAMNMIPNSPGASDAYRIWVPRSSGRAIALVGAVVVMFTVTVADWFGLVGLNVQFDKDGNPEQL